MDKAAALHGNRLAVIQWGNTVEKNHLGVYTEPYSPALLPL